MPKKRSITSRLSDSLDLPKEAALDLPIVKILGNNEVNIENHKGIVEYTKEILRLNSMSGIVKITGLNLQIKEISQEDIVILGEILSLEFIR